MDSPVGLSRLPVARLEILMEGLSLAEESLWGLTKATIPYNSRPMHFFASVGLLALQCFVALFVAFHNWIPLGRLNDLNGVRAKFPTGKLLITTLINFTPVAIGLAASAFYFRRGYPGWLFWWLWITYGLACYGSLMAWWIPYLFRPEPERAARYQVMYATTHAFLPERNGIRPNTLHVIFDVVTIAIIIVLAVLTAQSG